MMGRYLLDLTYLVGWELLLFFVLWYFGAQQ